MPKKYLIISLCVALGMLLLAGFSVWYAKIRSGLNRRGEYVFMQTRQKAVLLQQIKLTTEATGEIHIYDNNGEWRVKEAADYFADAKQLAAFYKMINNSVIIAVDEVSKSKLAAYGLDDEQKTLVETFDAEGNLLDSVTLGGGYADGEYRFAQLKGYPYIYTISEVGEFSGEAGAWMPFPLLEISADQVVGITISDRTFTLQEMPTALAKSKKFREFSAALLYVDYNGIALKKDFEDDFSKIEPRKIAVETEVGLVYNLSIYKIADDDYWLAVKLSTSIMPLKEVVPFVKNNQKYFADWVFNLNSGQGKILYDF